MKRRGFTIIEILIFTTLVSLITIAFLIYLDPRKQTIRAQNTRRKQDLEQLRNALEEWYNDKGCYPKPTELCHDTPVSTCVGGAFKTIVSQTCHICGRESTSPNLAPYLSELPCDPKHPANGYLYHVTVPSELLGQIACGTPEDTVFNDVCLQSYRIYTKFDYPNAEYLDPDAINAGCGRYGCGPTLVPEPTPMFGYDYGVSSPNVSLEMSTQYVCMNSIGICNVCGCEESDGDACVNYKKCYDSQGCINKQQIYSTGANCCDANGESACP